jgi:nucleoside 2-deoxyribosyltransferase
MKLYLAHPFDSRHRLREWELRVEEEMDIEIINPFFDVEREDSGIIKTKGTTLSSQSSRKTRYGLTDEDCEIIVERDVDLIYNVDGVIAIVDGSLSYGTIQEMVYAFNFGKPVYSVISNGHIGHPWLRYHSKRVFQSLRELENYFKKG